MRSIRLLLALMATLIVCRIPEAAAVTGAPETLVAVDEAIRQEFPQTGVRAVCSDSYLVEEPRQWLTVERESDEARLTRLAEVFERVRFQAGSFSLFRHERWYDPAFTRARKEKPGRVPRETIVQPIAAEDGSPASVKVDATRSTLNELCQALQKATGEPHAAMGWIAERRVTLVTSNSTPAELRAVLGHLFVDCSWVKDGRTWFFKERPDAARIRQVAETEAKRSRRSEEWAEAGLKTQLASDLTSAEWGQLLEGETVKLDWDQLSPGGRSLLVGWGRAFADTILERSNGNPENFADVRRTKDLGVRVSIRDGRLRVQSFGRTATGIAVIW